MLLRAIRLIIFAVLGLGTLSLSSVLFSHSALAADDPITITSQTETVHFPNYIDFDLNASDSSSPISQAIISITFDFSGGTSQEDNHTLKVSQPAQQVQLHWREDTTDSNFYPAGVHVSYHWQLQDSVGHWHTDAAQHFTTIDTRFNWRHLSQGLLQVNWYNRSSDFGQTMLNKASASIAHISTVLGSGLRRPINLWVYQTDDDFHGSLKPDSYEWVGGEAFPLLDEASVVVQDTSDNTLVRDMPHELTHLVFHQLIAQGVEVPTWFDEGLAMYNQVYHEQDMTARLQAALDAHALLRLDAITDNFPANSDQAYLAYAQSWNLVAYMYSTFGLGKMANFIKLLNNSDATFGQDLQQALGEDQAHLENQWHVHLHLPPILAPAQLTLIPTAVAGKRPDQAQVQTNTYDNSPLLLTIGIFLVLTSLVMLTLVMINVNRRRQRARAVESAQQLMAANVLRQQQGNQYRSYKDGSV